MKLATFECREDVLCIHVESVCFFRFFIVVGKVGARVLVVVVFFLDLFAVCEVITLLICCFASVFVKLLAFLLLLIFPSFAFLLIRLPALRQTLSPE